MQKYPFIKQEDLKDCGPACLAMIIKYYRGYIPISELCELSKTSKNGTDAYHLIEASKKVGFNARGIKKELDNNLILPIIAHVIINNNLGHFVVIYKINIKHNYIIIGDPAKGIYKTSIDDFKLIWNNILIELYPKSTLPKVGETSLLKFIINYINYDRKTIFVLFISSILITLFSCFMSFYFRLTIDNINTSKKLLTTILIVFIIVYLLKVIIDYLKNKIFISFKRRLDMNMSCNIFAKIIDLPYQYYRNRTTGEILGRFNDLEYVRQMLYHLIFSLFSDLPFIIGSIILLFIINSHLAVLSLIVLGIYTFVFLSFNPIFQKYISAIREQSSKTNSLMTESISGFESLNNCCLKESAKSKFANNYYELLNQDYKFSNFIIIRQIISEIIYQLGVYLIVYLGSMLVFDNKMSLGNLVMFYSVLMSFSSPLKNIIDNDLSIGQAKIALKRMLGVFIEKPDRGLLDNLIGTQIEFKNLDFYYNDIDLILSNINLKINPKEKVLIIGKSGSGKSTLLKLIMKYYSVNDGLYIDGININNYKNDILKDKIGYISQQETLFTDSILNNLDSSDFKEVLDISRICEIDKILSTRNINYYSMLEENGFNLSGGERQRIILGRLLLKKFDILLIDEGLNQMDINLERRILKRIFRKFKDKTIVIVSHRLENMDLYNHVIELSNGKIVKDVMKNE